MKDSPQQRVVAGANICGALYKFQHLLSSHADPMRRVGGYGLMGVEGRLLPLVPQTN